MFARDSQRLRNKRHFVISLIAINMFYCIYTWIFQITLNSAFDNNIINDLILNFFQIFSDGYISMDTRLDVGRPGLFSDTVSSGDRILAPFWSDIDLTEGSRVWYHLYQDDGSLGVRNYLSQAKAFIVQNILYPEGERETGDPNTLLVVTWERVVPAPRALSPTKVHLQPQCLNQIVFQ